MGEPKAGVMMSWNAVEDKRGEEIENERSCRRVAKVRQRRIDLTRGRVLRFDIAVRTGRRFAPSRTASRQGVKKNNRRRDRSQSIKRTNEKTNNSPASESNKHK